MMVIAVLVLLVVGVQPWRCAPLGYAAGPGLLLGYGLLALSVIPFFVAEARAAGATFCLGVGGDFTAGEISGVEALEACTWGLPR